MLKTAGSRATAGMLALSILAGAAPALAHHSNAMFDYTKGNERTLEGEVKQFLWTNPHGYLEMAVMTGSGKTQNWTVEFQAISGMTQRGLKIDSFKAGDKVKVVIHPLRNGTTGGDFYSAVLSDGAEIAPPKE